MLIGKVGNRDLHAQIAFPKDVATSHPAVVLIHGGGWVGGSFRSPGAVLHFAKMGYFALSVDYRLSSEAKWPAQIQDCKLAVRWVRANAASYDVDPAHIGAIGVSAGGHLAACLGTMADVVAYEGDGGCPGVSSAVQAVVDNFGPADFTRPAIYSVAATHLTERLLGATLAQNPDLWKSASPIAYAKAGDPPMLLMQGDADVIVPPAQATAFDQALTQAGVPHQLVIVKNAGHDFKPLPGTTIDPSQPELDKILAAFLDKYLKGTPTP
jgi:acetyl esterase/lipase